jgi:phage recombination protein Bet
MKELVKTNSGGALVSVTAEQKALVKSIIFSDGTDAELNLFFYECARRGVHPLDRKIFPIKRNDTESGGKKLTFQCSIDYFRSAALESGEYDGQDEPEYGPLGQQGFPEWAKVAVFRKGIDRPFIGIARWTEFFPGEKQGFMWKKMPHAQLAKCAEAMAFRKAFPQVLGGLHSDDEMHQADSPVGGSARSLAETIREEAANMSPADVDPAPAQDTDNRTVQERLKAEIETYEPNPGARPALLKSLTIFGKKGEEKWMKTIEGSSDKWCGKALENLRKLPARSPAAEREPGKSCTENPRTCDSSQWMDGGAVDCADTDKACPFTPNKEKTC